jgi:hypothetical protein
MYAHQRAKVATEINLLEVGTASESIERAAI